MAGNIDYLELVKKDGLRLKDVPAEERTLAIERAAVENNWMAIQYANYKTSELTRAAEMSRLRSITAERYGIPKSSILISTNDRKGFHFIFFQYQKARERLGRAGRHGIIDNWYLTPDFFAAKYKELLHAKSKDKVAKEEIEEKKKTEGKEETEKKKKVEEKKKAEEKETIEKTEKALVYRANSEVSLTTLAQALGCEEADISFEGNTLVTKNGEHKFALEKDGTLSKQASSYLGKLVWENIKGELEKTAEMFKVPQNEIYFDRKNDTIESKKKFREKHAADLPLGDICVHVQKNGKVDPEIWKEMQEALSEQEQAKNEKQGAAPAQSEKPACKPYAELSDGQKRMVDDPNPAIRKMAAEIGYGLDVLKEDTDPDVLLGVLSHDGYALDEIIKTTTNADVKRKIIQIAPDHPEIANMLQEEKDPSMRAFIVKNCMEHIPKEILAAQFSNEKDPSVLFEYARKGYQVEALAKHKNISVRAAAISQLSAQGVDIHEFGKDSAPMVRQVVARAGKDLSELKNDPDKSVRELATRVYESNIDKAMGAICGHTNRDVYTMECGNDLLVCEEGTDMPIAKLDADGNLDYYVNNFGDLGDAKELQQDIEKTEGEEIEEPLS